MKLLSRVTVRLGHTLFQLLDAEDSTLGQYFLR
jgi:hypothetical protein